jgi:hypothetical protein
VGEVAGPFVLQSQLFLLQSVEKVFVGMGSMLFFLDEGVKSLVLRLQFLDHCLVHWCSSFRSACHHRVVNHESRALSRGLSRFGGAVAPLTANGERFLPPRR